MNVNAIGGMAAQVLRPQESARPQVEKQVRPESAPVAPAKAARTVAASGLLAPRQEAPVSEVPAGTDPELWKVLTTEERAFFSRMSAGGPLTYGRLAALATPRAPMFVGGRLDVRV